MKALKMTGTCAAVVALACAFSGPAMAEVVAVAPGQPLFAGHDLDSTEGHGTAHCQPVAELLTGTDLPPGAAAGVIVKKPNGEFVLGAPRDGVCAAIYVSLGL